MDEVGEVYRKKSLEKKWIQLLHVLNLNEMKEDAE